MGGLFYNLKNFDADVTSWDTSSVTNMYQMFYVRSFPCPAPNLQSRHLRTLRAPRSPTASLPTPRPVPYALLPTLGRGRMLSTSR